MRELVVKYKAEKVGYEEMVKMPLVDLKVLKDESFRMGIDYRELSKIDIYSGCHEMRVHEDEIPRITFRMRYGHFELTVMPFGLTNAPAVFIELMSREEHESHLKMNLEVLKKEKCHVKPNKVEAKDDGWSDLGVVIVRPSTIWERANVVVDAWSRKKEVKSIRVRDICRTIQAKISKKMLVTHGQSERTFQTLENMFRACARNLVVVGILTFHEAKIGESKMIGLELEQETTNVFVIKVRLKEAKDRQKIKT
nr:putative reverse transcriptase domain-containing protein [Tanacetum cinerariifolium]